MNRRIHRTALSILFVLVVAGITACAPQEAVDNTGDTENTGDGGMMQGPEQTAMTPTLEPSWTVSGLEQPESALYDPARDVIYVSNISGQPNEKDGVGFISKVSPAGELLELKWAEGLNAPKGLGLRGDSLFVADLDRVVEISAESGEMLGEYPAEGAQFLNDIAVADDGAVYVSDMFADRIYVLRDGAVSVYLESADLQNPNGLFISGNTLYVGAWGVITDMATFGTETPGRLLSVTLGDAPAVSVVGDGKPFGNLDGLEGLDSGGFLASDWVSGAIYYLDPDGAATTLLTTAQGSADIGMDRPAHLLLLPMMMDGELRAYSYSF